MREFLTSKIFNEDYRMEDIVGDWFFKTVDALLVHNIEPAVGSIVYCNLAVAVEHTGIYIGDNRIVHLNGDGLIEAVSPATFCQRLDGRNPSFTIFCPVRGDGKILGDKKTAKRAKEQIRKYISYNVVLNNCHCFTASCLTGKHEYCPSFNLLEKLIMLEYGKYSWRATELNH